MVRGNVIHDIHQGLGGLKYPCVFAYGVRDENVDRPNIIDGNAMWSCGEAIQVVADAVVSNNLVLDSDWALATYGHEQVPLQRNLLMVNNTFYGSRLDLTFGKNAKPGAPAPSGIVFANNVIYRPGRAPVVSVDLPMGGGVTIRNNGV